MSSDWVPFTDLLSTIVDNRGRTCPMGDSGIPLIATNCIDSSSLYPRYDTTRFVSDETYRTWFRGHPEPGDILFVCKGSPGRTNWVPDPVDFCIAQDMVSVRADPKKVYPKYLFAALRSAVVLTQIDNMHVGTMIPHFKKGDFGKLNIPVLSRDAQQVVGDFYFTLSERITLLRETNATLEAIAQAIFRSWFVDFDPVRAKQEGRVPEGMDDATAALFPDSFEESELGLVPRGWRVDPLENWLSVLETGRRPKGGVSGIESGIPSIGAESITRMGEFEFGKTKYVSHEFFEKMKSGALESRDVLLYKDGGKPGVFLPRVSMFGDGFPFETCGINEHVFRIRLKEPFGQTFLYFWLWSDAVMHELKHRGGKAAIPGINQADVKEQRIAVPDRSILARYEEVTSPLVSAVFKNAKQAQTLAMLRDTLLPRLISGQLRLPDLSDLEACLET
jgi:type I restriction enzyme S subunit